MQMILFIIDIALYDTVHCMILDLHCMLTDIALCGTVNSMILCFVWYFANHHIPINIMLKYDTDSHTFTLCYLTITGVHGT